MPPCEGGELYFMQSLLCNAHSHCPSRLLFETMFGFRSVHFSPKKDIPALEGKITLVTGGNSGLGKQCVLEFARHKPAQIWLAARKLVSAC